MRQGIVPYFLLPVVERPERNTVLSTPATFGQATGIRFLDDIDPLHDPVFICCFIHKEKYLRQNYCFTHSNRDMNLKMDTDYLTLTL